MNTRITPSTICLLLLAAPACDDVGAIDKLDIMIERWDRDAGCFRRCEGTAPLSLANLAPSACAEGSLGPSRSVTPCVFEGGWEPARVTVAYPPVEFRNPSPPPIQVSAVVNGVAQSAKALETRVEYDGQLYAYAEVATPHRVRGTIGFEIHMGEANEIIELPEVVFGLEPAIARIDFPDCPQASSGVDCELRAGVDSLHVLVEQPHKGGDPPATARLVQQIAQGARAFIDHPFVRDSQDPQIDRLHLEVAVPEHAGQHWTVGLFALSAHAQRTVAIRPTTDIRSWLEPHGVDPSSPICTTPPTPLRRARVEPNPECRQLRLCVVAPDLPTQRQIRIDHFLGALEGHREAATFTVDDSGMLALDYQLPNLPEDPTTIPTHIGFQITAEPVDSRPYELSLADLHPEQPGTLTSLQSPVNVGATGSAELRLQGVIAPPSGTKFPPNTRAMIRVRATPDDSVELECGRKLTEGELRCDPDAANGDVGGCVATAFFANVSPDGRYDISVRAGLCFAGELEIIADMPMYDPANTNACLGERDTIRAEHGIGVVRVPFVAAPAEDPGEGDGSGR